MIDEKKLIEELEKQIVTITTPEDPEIRTKYWNAGIKYALNSIERQPKVGEWIPFTERKLTTEEKEEMNTEYDYILDCKLPDNDEEILVCSKFGHVFLDTFINDCDGCYLDSGYDFIEYALAWMPLPAPYNAERGGKND